MSYPKPVRPAVTLERIELAKRWAITELKAPKDTVRRQVAETFIAVCENMRDITLKDQLAALQTHIIELEQRFAAEQPSGVKVAPAQLEMSVTIPRPVPMVLACPSCGCFHVDGGEWATTREHRTHLCAHCSHEWRPFPFSTVGIAPDSIAIPPVFAKVARVQQAPRTE